MYRKAHKSITRLTSENFRKIPGKTRQMFIRYRSLYPQLYHGVFVNLAQRNAFFTFVEKQKTHVK